MTEPIKKIELDYAYLEIYDQIIVSTIFEGVNFDIDQVEELRNFFDDEFNGRPYIYISRRENSYSVNPIIYIDLIKKGHLKGIGIVSINENSLSSADFEKKFSPVPYEVFSTTEEALTWAKKILMNA